MEHFYYLIPSSFLQMMNTEDRQLNSHHSLIHINFIINNVKVLLPDVLVGGGLACVWHGRATAVPAVATSF